MSGKKGKVSEVVLFMVLVALSILFFFLFVIRLPILFPWNRAKHKSFIYNPKNFYIIMEILIDVGNTGFVVEDLGTWVAHHSGGAIIDGDRNTITITDPDREFLDELDRRGIGHVHV